MKQIIIHTFTQREIESLDFSRFDGLFGHWPQLWGMELKEKFDSLVFLTEGYDHHPDEIYCIQKVRTFYQELHRRWPWWCFFLSNANASLAVAYLCLIDGVASCKRDANPMCAASFNPGPLLEILRHDFGRLNYLWSISGMTEEANDKRSDEILELFTGGITHE